MKHVSALSKQQPTKANQIQEIICQVALFAGALLGSFGGASPVISFANDKCDLPQPGDGETTV